jgi:hypothetical protein
MSILLRDAFINDEYLVHLADALVSLFRITSVGADNHSFFIPYIVCLNLHLYCILLLSFQLEKSLSVSGKHIPPLHETDRSLPTRATPWQRGHRRRRRSFGGLICMDTWNLELLMTSVLM